MLLKLGIVLSMVVIAIPAASTISAKVVIIKSYEISVFRVRVR